MDGFTLTGWLLGAAHFVRLLNFAEIDSLLMFCGGAHGNDCKSERERRAVIVGGPAEWVERNSHGI
jgi:hypothetical protein